MYFTRPGIVCLLALPCLLAACEAEETDRAEPGPEEMLPDEGAGGSTGGGGGGLPVGTGGSISEEFDMADPFAVAMLGGPDRNTIEAGQICSRLTTIQCAAEALCCTSPGRTFDECWNTMHAGCVNELLLDATSLIARVGFDADHTRDAFTQFEEMASLCDPNIASWGADLPGLAGMFKGTVNAGSSCAPPMPTNPTTVEASASLVSCIGTATHGCMPADLMEQRLFWRCEPRSSVGGDCFFDGNCSDGLFCDNPGFAASTARCKARITDGGSCGQPHECESLMCKGGTCVGADVQAAYCLDAP